MKQAPSMMKIDKYSLKARYFPAVLSIVFPILVFNHFYASSLFAEFVDNIIGMKIISDITISAIALFLFSQIGRLVGKSLENAYFKDETSFFTTQYLSYKNQFYPDSFKRNIAQRVYKDFSIQLMDRDEEDGNYTEAIKLIVLAISQIRKKLYDNQFLLQHNVEYGFARNLIGGSIIGLTISLINIYFFSTIQLVDLAKNISISLGLIYFLLILLSKWILILLSKSYAKILFREYT